MIFPLELPNPIGFHVPIESPFSPTFSLNSFTLTPSTPTILNVAPNQVVISPFSKIKSTPYQTTITTDLYTSPFLAYDHDIGMNDNYLVQKKTTEHFLKLFLHKYLYKSDYCYLLKYLKYENNKITYVSSEEEKKNNKICNDTVDIVEMKIEFIEENIFDVTDMRKVLQRIISELGYKWYNLIEHKQLVIDVAEKYLKKKLRKHIY